MEIGKSLEFSVTNLVRESIIFSISTSLVDLVYFPLRNSVKISVNISVADSVYYSVDDKQYGNR